MAMPGGGEQMRSDGDAVASSRRPLPYDELFDRMPDAALVADRNARFVAANRAAQVLLGYDEQELCLLTVADIMDEVGPTTTTFARFVEDGAWRGQIALRRKDGVAIGAEGRAFALEDGLFVSVLREVGPRIGGLLGSSAAELAAIVESSNDAIFSKTLDGIILSWNRAAQRMYGYRADEVVGKHVSILAPDEERKEEIDRVIMERLRRGEDIRDFRTKRVTRDGRLLDVWLSISPVRDASGTIVGAATIARDITLQVELERELERARDQLEIITQASADGITIQDETGRMVYANDAAAHISGYPDAATFLAAPLSEVVSHFEILTEDGRPFPLDDLPGRRVLRGDQDADTLVRVRTFSTGEEHWRYLKSTPLLDEDGRVRFSVNVFHDVTELKRVEEELRFRTLLLEEQAEASDEGILVMDTEGRMVSWNRRFLETMRITEEEVRSVTRSELLDRLRDRLEDADEAFARIRSSWERLEDEVRDEFRFLDGRVVERLSTPLRDDSGRLYGRVSFFRDVTAERKRERAQRFLAEASRELGASLDYEATLQRVTSLAVPELADWCAVDLVEPGGAIRLIAVAHVDPAKVEWARELRKRFPVDVNAMTGLPSVIRTGRSELYPVVPMEQMEAAAGGDPAILEIVHELEIRSVMIVPLVARGQTLGAIQFVWAESGRSYDEDDLRLAEDVASRAALALDNARLYGERDHIAQTLQQSLLPGPLPAIEGIRLAARYRAAGRGIEVGGDFYDVFDVGGGAHALVIGDVCGKGPKAAALMGAARHTIRTAAMQQRRPSEVLGTLNTALHQRLADQWFCTVAYVRMRRATDGARLTVCCGGHPLPVVVRVDGTVEFAGRPGTLLGVFPDVELTDTAVDLHVGDALVLYTDGVTDEQRDSEEFGVERLADVLRETAGSDPGDVAAAIEDAVLRFRPDEPTDDLAVLVVKVAD
ncbi:MAG: PAS domain S-box protein [Actinomycetota bacterium]